MKASTICILTSVAFVLPGSAAISIFSSGNDNGSATNPIEFNSVSVNAGDVVAIATSVNKNLTQVDFTLGTTAGAGDVTSSNFVSADEVHGAHVHYLTVVNAGSYNFTVDPTTASTFTSNSTIYVLRADSGSVSVADTASLADTGTPTSSTLDYAFGSSLTTGSAVAVEALTTQSGAITVDSDYTLDLSGGSGKRNTAHSTTVSGVSWSGAHALVPDNDDFVGVGVVFTESIPEPSSFLLFAAALSTALIWRRR